MKTVRIIFEKTYRAEVIVAVPDCDEVDEIVINRAKCMVVNDNQILDNLKYEAIGTKISGYETSYVEKNNIDYIMLDENLNSKLIKTNKTDNNY